MCKTIKSHVSESNLILHWENKMPGSNGMYLRDARLEVQC